MAFTIMGRFAARQAVRPETYVVEQGLGDSKFVYDAASKIVWVIGCNVSQGCEATVPISAIFRSWCRKLLGLTPVALLEDFSSAKQLAVQQNIMVKFDRLTSKILSHVEARIRQAPGTKVG